MVLDERSEHSEYRLAPVLTFGHLSSVSQTHPFQRLQISLPSPSERSTDDQINCLGHSPWQEANASVGDYGTHHVVLVRWNHLRIHGTLHIEEVPGNHDDAGGEVVHDVGDAESDADQDIHDVAAGDAAGDAADGEGGDGIDDEGDDQNHGKLEPMVAMEVHHAIPIPADDHRLLD